MNEITIADIKCRLDIVDVIGRIYGYSLTKDGDEYKGAILATSKSGKSLNVNPDKQVYNDFSGHAGGGDVLDFIAFAEGLDIQRDFVQVLHVAAQHAEIVLDYNLNYPEAAERRELQRLNRHVFGYYHSCLTDERREYIKTKWGLSDKYIDDMLIGYAPENSHMLQVSEIKDYFSTEILKKSGLFYCNDNDMLVDIYRGRIIFPYWNRGEIVYSIGRDPKWIKDSKSKKFIKQLVHSDKYPYVSEAVQNVLFGEDSLRGNDIVYITEGIADAGALLQAGKACISPVTVSFKEKDIEPMVQACRNKKLVKIINDNEENESGINGAIKTAKSLESAGIRTEIILLPRPDGVDKIDVADYLKEHNIEELDAILGQSVWETLLYSSDVPEKEHERPRAAKQFIECKLAQMRRTERKAFCLSAVRKYYGLSAEIMRDILRTVRIESGTDKYYSGEGRFIPTKLSEDIQKDHIFATFGNEIWIYHPVSGCYQPDGEPIIRKRVRDVLQEDSIEKFGNEVVYDISVCTQADRIEFDKENEFVNLHNGYVNIYTGEFFQHSPEMKFTSALPIVYDPAANCPKFDDFIKCTGVDRTQILEAFSYCLVPGYPIHTFIMFIGDGGNGKGTALRLLNRFLGSNNTRNYTMQELTTDRYAKAGLYGKYANICGDMPAEYVKDTAIIKTLSGGDPITVRNIYEKQFDFTNRAKLIFSMNHLPQFDDTTDSTFRRAHCIEFNNRVIGMMEGFNEEDLAAEIPGIFNEALKVLPELLERGEFTGKKSIEENREYMLNKADSVAAFMRMCADEGDGKTRTQDAYTAYTKFCTENRFTRVTNAVFGKRLKSLFPEIYKIPIVNEGARDMHYVGMLLKPQYTNLDQKKVDEEYTMIHNGTSKNPIDITKTQGKHSKDIAKTQQKNANNQHQEAEMQLKDTANSIIFNENLKEKESDENADSQKYREIYGSLPCLSESKQSIDSEKPSDLCSVSAVFDEDLLCLMNAWEEQHNERISKKNHFKAVQDIAKARNVRSPEYSSLEAAIKRITYSRCVECGSSELYGTSKDTGEKRCKACYDRLFTRPAVAIPEELVL